MPIYLYGCESNKDHPRQTISHGIKEVIRVLCPECGGACHRIPQLFQTRIPPTDAGQRNAKEINNYLESKYRSNKARREAQEAAHRHAQEKGQVNG